LDSTLHPALQIKYILKSTDEQLINNGSIVSFFPNPIENQLFLKINVENSCTAQINIFNIIGEKLYSTSGQYAAGNYFTTIPLDELPKGIYFVEFCSERIHIIQKLVK
jgi:hypothetical protein